MSTQKNEKGTNPSCGRRPCLLLQSVGLPFQRDVHGQTRKSSQRQFIGESAIGDEIETEPAEFANKKLPHLSRRDHLKSSSRSLQMLQSNWPSSDISAKSRPLVSHGRNSPWSFDHCVSPNDKFEYTFSFPRLVPSPSTMSFNKRVHLSVKKPKTLTVYKTIMLVVLPVNQVDRWPP